MKIAVTTASGQLGKTIVKKIIKEMGTEQVIAIARSPQKIEDLGIETRKGDYDIPEDFETALKGVDAVLIVSSNDYPKKRLQQHLNVIEAAKANGVQKIVYTSILGDGETSAFTSIVDSNRQTEEDVKNSGLTWSIGRNGLYIEPDLEAIEHYIKAGNISNSAGEGKCAYTNREELANAYFKMLTEDKHNGQIYNLGGKPITQQELTDAINEIYGTNLTYKPLSIEEYLKERKDTLGVGMGTVIGGIYAKIANGSFDVTSDFEKATGRSHLSALEMIRSIKENSN